MPATPGLCFESFVMHSHHAHNYDYDTIYIGFEAEPYMSNKAETEKNGFESFCDDAHQLRKHVWVWTALPRLWNLIHNMLKFF